MPQEPATSATSSKSRRRWFQFSLRTLLLLMTAFGVWFGVQVNRVHRQKAAIAAVKEAGGVMAYEYQSKNLKPPGPDWLRQLIGVDYFTRLVTVNFWKADPTDAILEQLRDQNSVTYLFVDGNRVTNLGLEFVGGMTNLTYVHINGPDEITDAGLAHLRNLVYLISLNIVDCPQVTDAGMEHLSGLVNIRHLALRNASITDAGLKKLKPLVNLKGLEVGGTDVTGEGVAELKKALPNCTIGWSGP